MNQGEREAVVWRIADEIWNRGDLAVVEEVMAPDAKYHGAHMPGGVGSREDWRGAIGMYLGAFPDSHVVYEELLSAGETVVGRWSATGTHTGELPGVPTSGKAIRIGGISIYRFGGDRIVETWEQLDLLGMWIQLGAVSLPGH